MLYGWMNVFSLIFITGVVALILGMDEGENAKESTRHALGCWAKLLGSLIGIGLVAYILSLFAG
jgi:hypothetical protein